MPPGATVYIPQLRILQRHGLDLGGTPSKPAPVPVAPSVKVEAKDAIDEPPLAPAPGPIVNYHVTTSGETFKTLSKKTLGTVERWTDIHKLNPSLKADAVLAVGTMVRLPGDACVAEDDTVKPLPALRTRGRRRGSSRPCR